MAEIKYVNILDAISEFRNYHTSIILSYGANLAFYEQGVLNLFWQSGCRTNLIFMDNEKYLATIPQCRDILGYIGRRYLVVPINIGAFQAFHPKIILLLGSEQARLLVGSGNLTFNGYGDNLEIFTQIDWSTDSNDYQSVFSEVWNIIITIQKRWGNFKQTDSMLEKAELKSNWLLNKINPNTDVQVISSLDLPIMDQLTEYVGKQRVERITIISPFLDKKSKAIEKLNLKFSPKEIRLILQNRKTCGDIKSLNRLRSSGVPIDFYSFETDDERYLHAKLYAIEGTKESILAIGSANCTQAGMLGNSQVANLETLVIHKNKTKEALSKILSKHIGEQYANLPNTFFLRPDSPNEYLNNRLLVNLQEAALYSQSIIVKLNVLSKSVNPSQAILKFSSSDAPTIPIGPFTIGNNIIELHLTDDNVKFLNNKICAASICKFDIKSQKLTPISNSIWVTNIVELNKSHIFLTPADEHAGKLLNEMHLGSDEDWRDLYDTLLNLVEFEMEKLAASQEQVEKRNKSNIFSESVEKESILRDIEFETDVSEVTNKDKKNHNESTLHSWLDIVFSHFPAEKKSNSNNDTKTDSQKTLPHPPNPTLEKRYIRLVRRYIRSLNNSSFMGSASPFHLTAYFSIFQKVIWLLYEHQAVDKEKLAEYIIEIHQNFFGRLEDNSVPFGAGEIHYHLSWKYRQQWRENFTHLFALASLIAIEGFYERFDELFIQALANICLIERPSDIVEDQDSLAQIANSYDISYNHLSNRILENINRLSLEVLGTINNWNTVATLALKDMESTEIKQQWMTLVNIGIAAERISEYINNTDEQIFWCSELIFWSEQLNLTSVNNDYREKLVELYKSKGDLPALARTIFEQGKLKNSERDYKQAIKLFLQAKPIAEEVGNKALLKTIDTYLNVAKLSSKKY